MSIETWDSTTNVGLSNQCFIFVPSLCQQCFPVSEGYLLKNSCFFHCQHLCLQCHKKVELLDWISLCLHIKNLMFAFGGTFALLKIVWWLGQISTSQNYYICCQLNDLQRRAWIYLLSDGLPGFWLFTVEWNEGPCQ